MIPATDKATAFTGDHVDPAVSVDQIVWTIENGGLSLSRYDDGTIVVLSRRTDQPTRAYELSADDVAALTGFLNDGAE